jgi:hypothetical protein
MHCYIKHPNVKQERRDTLEEKHEKCCQGVRDVDYGLLIVFIHAVYVRVRGVSKTIGTPVNGRAYYER